MDRYEWALLIVFVLLSAGAAWAFVEFQREAHRRRRVLLDAVENLARGDLGTRVRLPGGDEISMMAEGVNRVAEALSQHSASYSTFDGLPEPVWVSGEDAELRPANAAARGLTASAAWAPDSALRRAWIRCWSCGPTAASSAS